MSIGNRSAVRVLWDSGVAMARRDFFSSLHYDNDIQRVGRIRNGGIGLAAGDPAAGVIDYASWESGPR